MLNATEIRVGNIIRLEGKTFRVLSREMKGAGKSAKHIHLKLKNVDDGHIAEKSVRAEEKIEDVEFRRTIMQYLYQQDEHFIFMNMETYEQFPVSSQVVGKHAVLLKENVEIEVDSVEDRVVGINFPKLVELKVVTAPPGTRGASDSNYKEVELENGMKVLVPQFVKEGETIRLNTEDFSYQERVSTRSI